MNLQQLRYAVEVEKTSSITQAAKNLYMGQPNLSKSIKELEQDLGITIFTRNAKGVEPTSMGLQFLRYAHEILDKVDELSSCLLYTSCPFSLSPGDLLRRRISD